MATLTLGNVRTICVVCVADISCSSVIPAKTDTTSLSWKSNLAVTFSNWFGRNASTIRELSSISFCADKDITPHFSVSLAAERGELTAILFAETPLPSKPLIIAWAIFPVPIKPYLIISILQILF